MNKAELIEVCVAQGILRNKTAGRKLSAAALEDLHARLSGEFVRRACPALAKAQALAAARGKAEHDKRRAFGREVARAKAPLVHAPFASLFQLVGK